MGSTIRFPGHLSRRERGGMVLGVILGLVVGLAIAVMVAVYVNKAPVPFLNKVKPQEKVPNDAKDAAQLPDPNKPLYGKDTSGEKKYSFYDVLSGDQKDDAAKASAPRAEAARPAPAPVDTGKGAPVSEKSAAGTQVARAEPRPDASRDEEKVSYFLQAGAFRTPEDADNTKAKLTLLGFDVKVSQADANGNPVYRVRIGPYARLDDMNRVRARLAENGVEASVVKQK
jgi:cell division protein FtsN